MATIALLTAACSTKEDATKAPITKPEITIEGGRLTPEALWAMGRINSVLPNEQTNQIAYTVSYYSVEENRSTSWIRVAHEQDNQLVTINEWVGYEPAWWGNQIAYQFFIEPCGEDTEEMYLQGLSSSLPEEVQIELYKTIPCLKNVKIMRNAYAIEYDCVDPQALKATLEMKDFEGLYGAGQFNGRYR